MNYKANLTEFCRQLIRFPSPSGQEKAVAHFIADTMRAYGFDEVTIDRYGSVLGRINGSMPGKAVLMDGHIDTVDPSDPSLWTHDPYAARLVEGKIYGRGASDMKGSVGVMISAAAQFAADTGRKFAGSISVSCTVQEECFEGVSAREITKGRSFDYVIVGEATNCTLKRGQRGRAEVVLETTGKTCHSANPEAGINAIEHMCALIEKVNKIEASQHPLLGKGIFALTDIISHPYPGASVIPGLCRATYDRRLLAGETKEFVLSQVEDAIAAAKRDIPNLQARAFIANGRETCWTGEKISAERFFPAWVVEEESEIMQKAVAGLREAGIDPVISHFSFCTNGSHFCGEAGIPTIGFGPSLEHLAHVIDEYVEVEQLHKAFDGFCGILRAFTR